MDLPRLFLGLLLTLAWGWARGNGASHYFRAGTNTNKSFDVSSSGPVHRGFRGGFSFVSARRRSAGVLHLKTNWTWTKLVRGHSLYPDQLQISARGSRCQYYEGKVNVPRMWGFFPFFCDIWLSLNKTPAVLMFSCVQLRARSCGRVRVAHAKWSQPWIKKKKRWYLPENSVTKNDVQQKGILNDVVEKTRIERKHKESGFIKFYYWVKIIKPVWRGAEGMSACSCWERESREVNLNCSLTIKGNI